MNGIGLLGQKVGMTQVYTQSGRAVPVTVLQLGPCPVLQLKNKETDYTTGKASEASGGEGSC